MRLSRTLRELWDAFDAEDDPGEPAYDPVHLGAALLLTLTAVGALYWLLWTLLVFEGGLFVKLGPGLQVLLGLKTTADFGWRGPWDHGVFEGWLGNLGALALCALLVWALHRLYRDADRRCRAKR
ncbi:MAG: hypothetical protein KGO96_07905 [Elusimicrobia bacterium]|nr:hypothetical protein [Elusimicrobiota bacterium]MDE2236842.1 hypothetical protein [Elusimicrobiota bacterium]MDE2425816.1 hypothetical protein [Elusimicrobiota bacterium]